MGTHQNFKSLDPKVPDANKISYLVGEALENQSEFDKGTTSWEMQEWGENELGNFKIDLEKIDRLYYINFFNKRYRSFELVGRMEYNGGYVFVKMTACCDYVGFNSIGSGLIFISSNPTYFLQSLSNKYPIQKISQSLIEDGFKNIINEE